MNILVFGGTRFFGIHLVRELLAMGHKVTIATRGKARDEFGDRVKRLTIEKTDPQSLKETFAEKEYDLVYDNLAYASNDVKHTLDNVTCQRYILMSSTAVYQKHMDTREEDFDPASYELTWCSRPDFSYEEVKRQAECALTQKYASQDSVAARYPFVLGDDDYTKRLEFYVEHILKGIPMHVDNVENQMGFIRSDEAGRFLAFLADKDYRGPINGCSHGTKSIREIADYIEKKTGRKPVYSEQGDPAPYNGEPAYSINIDRAEGLGFQFLRLDEWIYPLLDRLIEKTI
ncbi:MAG: NAD-dependent epimerase/dehydratase family protein [Spirochaetales bacterium]|nr:NAD-dependent epimerase/dehydratase family protein [Spirochaetales bacterium]